MTAFERTAACASIGLLLLAGRVHGGEALEMHVTPAASRAPGYMTVRVRVRSTINDRLLRIVAESPDFYRSSEIQIDGADAPSLNVFEFRDLPAGLYSVTGTLVGDHGVRARVSRIANVQPTFGR